MSLSKLLRNGLTPSAPLALPEPKALHRAEKRIAERWPHISPEVKEMDREKVAQDFLVRVERGDWAGYKTDDVIRAARAIFDEKRNNRPDLAPARAFLIAETHISTRPALLGGIVEMHIENFKTQAPHTKALIDGIRAARARLPMRAQKLLETLPEALDATYGASKLGARMAAHGKPEALFADQRGLLAGGLFDEAGAAFIKGLAPKMRDPEVAKICLDWFAPKSGATRYFGAEAAIDALIAPWHEDEPPAKWKEILLRRLCEAYGDPRLTNGGMCRASTQKTQDTIIRWLTGATLEAFLDIVSKAEDSHMWADRRPFWQNLYRQGHIEAAWVAFSKRAADIASQMALESGETALKHFGVQRARSNTSILLLRIKGKVIVEGSHSYKVHVFPYGHPKEPKLYQETYDCEKIRLSLPDTDDYKKSHHGDAWKRWVERKTL